MRILLDTNIFVAGLLSSKGPPAKLIRAWLDGTFELVTARQQIDELTRVLEYPRLRGRFGAAQRQEILGNIEVLAIVATDLPTITLSNDASDNIILAIAVAGQADLVVSGDKPDVLALRDVAGIPIVSARRAVEMLGLVDA